MRAPLRTTLAVTALSLICSIGTATESPTTPDQATEDVSAHKPLWGGFYTSSGPKAPTDASTGAAPSLANICITEILSAQRRFNIPDNLLLAIGLQEAGRTYGDTLTVWPWTVNADGEGMFFPDRASMLDWVRAKQAAGIASIDVGCMQINQYWHGDAFASLEAAANPARNVEYAARYLRSLFIDTGNWWTAAGRYHSSTQDKQEIYLNRLEHNLYVAQTRLAELASVADIATAPTTPDAPDAPEPPVFWGSSTLIVESGEQTTNYSIYSNRPLTPILPNYDEAN